MRAQEKNRQQFRMHQVVSGCSGGGLVYFFGCCLGFFSLFVCFFPLCFFAFLFSPT